MFLRISLVLSLALVSNITWGQPPSRTDSPKSVKQYPIEEFLRTTRYAGASFSPDNEKILVSSDESGILNAYAIPVNGGPAKQLTHSTKESILSHGYFPGDVRFLYSADQGWFSSTLVS